MEDCSDGRKSREISIYSPRAFVSYLYQDHPNFGLCLDTAHFPLTLGYGWNPRTGEGWTEADFQNILSFIRALPVEKIFYVELSDVLPPVIPLGQGSPFDEWCNNAKTSRGDRFLWAMVARPVPLIGRDAGRSIKAESDMGGARVVEALRVILEIGYNGKRFRGRKKGNC